MQANVNIDTLIERSIQELPRDKRLEFGDIITIAMHVVELLQQATPDALKQSGAEKRRLAKDLAWQVVQIAYVKGFITKEEEMQLQGYFTLAADIMDGLINAFHFIKQNPTYIQLEEHVKAKCASCTGKRSRAASRNHR